MAAFTTSEYGKFATIQNNSGSADASAPSGGVYLFASGAVGSSKLYLNVEGSTDNKELGADLKIAGDSGTGTVSLGGGQTLTIAGGTGLDTSVSSQTVTFSVDLGELPEEALAVADDYIVFLDGGATGASKKEKLADVVGNMAGDGLGASNGVLAVQIGTNKGLALTSDALEITASAVAAANVAVAEDSFMFFDADGSVKEESFVDLVGAMAGTVTSTGLSDSNGVLSLDIQNMTAVTTVEDGDLVVIDDGAGGTLRKMTRANFIESAALDSINIDGGAVDGITLGTNSAVTQGVITSLTASHARITNLDAVTINSISQTETTLEVSDKLIVSALSASSSDASGGGLKIGGGATSNGHASVLWDDGNSALDFNIGGTTEIRLADGVLRPETDNDVDLGASGAEFKDLYLDGVAYIDSLQADQLGAALDANDQAITNINVDSGAIDGTTVGANSQSSGKFTTLSGSGAATFASTVTAQGNILPFSDGAVDLGSSSKEFKDLYIDGVAYIDSLQADQLGAALDANSQAITNINVDSGAIDGTIIGANSAANGNFAQLTSSFGIRVNSLPAIIASNQINGAAGAAIQFDGSANVSIVNSLGVSSALTVGGGFGSTGLTVTDAGNLNMDGQLLVGNSSQFRGDVNFSGSSNTAPDVTFKQDGDQNGFLRWDSSENHLYLQYGSSGGNGVQVLTVGGNATSDYAIDVVNGSNNINKVRAAAFVTYSDESLKSDVASMSNTALDTVMSLEGVEFTWKDSGERDFGFIAQDVQSVLPKAVHTADDGVQGVDYSRLTSVLVEAVKAQQVQIEDLKKTITNLKK